MAEFSIIEDFCHGIGPDHAETILSVGDDAAIVAIPEGMELAISVDTMVADVHFYADASPASIAHKLFAVNLSDMAAMGAIPKWATLTLSIPVLDRAWLKAFSDSLKVIADRYKVQVIGGDTTQGPLNLSINIMGLLPKGKALSRSGAQLGDDVYVSHSVGDAALGLLCVQGKLTPQSSDRAFLVNALEKPQPRVELGQRLLSVANACLDVSDGLIGDLAHISERSKVSIQLNVDSVPISSAYENYTLEGGNIDLALNGGDDYELAFTASADQREGLALLSKELDIRLTRIGQVVPQASAKVSLFKNGQPYQMTSSNSFEHFS